LLFGLYEGTPRIQRQDSGYSLPDKITIFKNPILLYTGGDYESVKQQVARTVLHEIEHHFGFNESEVRKHEADR